VLVEKAAIEHAEKENAGDEARREAQRQRRRAHEEVTERSYVAAFTAKILALFPAAPPEAAEVIAARACEKFSGRVGRSALAKSLDAGAVTLAVWAHVRHTFTESDRLLAAGLEPIDARAIVRPAIERVVARWREGDGDEKREVGRPSRKRLRPNTLSDQGR
jgi:hypothetical protein